LLAACGWNKHLIYEEAAAEACLATTGWLVSGVI